MTESKTCQTNGTVPFSCPGPFLVEALRADKLANPAFTGRDHAFTPLLDAYEANRSAYYISSMFFTPHSCACASGATCPGCP